MSSILVSGGIVITMDPHRRIIRNGSVSVLDDRICEVGKTSEINSTADLKIDAEGMLVLPGLIDTHVHLAQALIRGCADDASLIDWLQKYVWPLQGNFDDEDGKTSAELCMLEMIKSGTTTFLESNLSARYGFDGIAKSLNTSGMRGVLSRTVMSLPSYGGQRGIMHPGMIEDPETCLREVEAHHKNWNGKGEGRINVWYGARSLGGCTPELYRQVSDRAKRLDTGVTMHLGEVQEDVRFAKKEYGKTPVEFMDSVGLVRKRVVFAHGVWFTDNEWQILAKKGASVAHCPCSNMKLASGVARVPEMINTGVNVGLGCDGGPSNNCYDLIREMKLASLLQKVRLLDPLSMKASTVLELATVNGAAALGMQSQIGSIEVGKKADLILLSLKRPHLTPMFNPVSHLAYAAEGSDVETVIINGKIIMEKRQVKTLDESKILQNAENRGCKLLERTGISISPDFVN
jgi:cytosine/adenosine deaminase-related metal-dependent hydrolase